MSKFPEVVSRISPVAFPVELIIPFAKKSSRGVLVVEYGYVGRALVGKEGVISQGAICAHSWHEPHNEKQRTKFSIGARTERAIFDIDLPEHGVFRELLFPGETERGEDYISYSEKDWEIR
ncbi:hypothetical protein A9K97_gp344 [Tokyovirus A1]|uniref:hypothetical protein n=1 Tax=Tokyovirus A1 TaxID=1826170 RepID=UPI0007A97072|nr:hypothetical protein A9K97_gp344 [Tokyovirus A1]BAU80007.1 hypothetical protein [Tokyovirus A1]